MKVAICWSGTSGYLSACWRALSGAQGIELTVFAEPADQPYSADILAGLNLVVLSEREWLEPARMACRLRDLKPDVVVISGWSRKGFSELPFQPGLEAVRFVLAMDTPWRGDLRQRLAKVFLRKLVGRMSAVFVSGERGVRYAEALGFPPSRICPGVYGFDYDSFSPAMAQRLTLPEWPQRFLFVGRYVPVKGIDTLVEAYGRYRQRVKAPWPLCCYGAGELRERLSSAAGVEAHGFIQPGDQPAMFAQHGALVMPSLYEPWGVVLAEAGAAGLPAICSSSVCSSVDLVRHLYNGYVVPPGDAESLAQALCWFHDHAESLPKMGARSQVYAEAFSAQNWAARWSWLIKTVASDQ